MQFNIPLTLSLVTLFTLTPVSAFWRLGCKGNLVVDRLDPIVNPGAVSGHLHTIVGGNAFGASMTYADTQRSTCSTCTIKQDLSNYWVPTLYYKGQDGTFTSVKQSGMVVYYLQRADSKDPEYSKGLLAFPEGFRMLAGDPFLRSYNDTNAQRAISYACLGSNTRETPYFPNIKCPGGLRTQVFFPSCWDGQPFTLKDQHEHLAYPSRMDNGFCSPPFNKRLISIFYEVVWSTPDFDNLWYGDKQPFVWSSGDDTGYGGHGDFVNGWDVPTLQKAVTECTDNSGVAERCPHFTFANDNDAKNCKIPVQVREQSQGVLSALPGCNPVQSGPERAKPGQGCPNTVTTIGPPLMPYTDVRKRGWKYIGCMKDIQGQARTLPQERKDFQDLTIEKCVDYCASKGYTFSGVEYSRECYCSNTITSGRLQTQESIGFACTMPCAGNSQQTCGGAALISIYQRCVRGRECKDIVIPFINGGY